MNKKYILFSLLPFIILSIVIQVQSLAQESRLRQCPPDKELCALMIRHGVEAFGRGKYQEARAYFRRAIAADPESELAWRHYDLSMLYDLGKQIATTGRYISSVPSVTISIPEERPLPEKAPPPVKPHLPEARPPVKKDVARPPAKPPLPKELTRPPAPEEKKPTAKEEPKGAIIVDDEGC